MSNVDIVRAWFEAYARRDMEVVLAAADPDIEVRPALVGGLEGRVHRGRDGLRDFLEEVDATWTDFRIELAELRDLGDRVMALGHTWGGGRDGIAVDAPGGWVLDIRDGLVSGFRSFNSWEDTLEAAGVDR